MSFIQEIIHRGEGLFHIGHGEGQLKLRFPVFRNGSGYLQGHAADLVLSAVKMYLETHPLAKDLTPEQLEQAKDLFSKVKTVLAETTVVVDKVLAEIETAETPVVEEAPVEEVSVAGNPVVTETVSETTEAPAPEEPKTKKK